MGLKSLLFTLLFYTTEYCVEAVSYDVNSYPGVVVSGISRQDDDDYAFYQDDYTFCAITGIGDYNKDGYDDAAFSGCMDNPLDDSERRSAGIVYVLFGGNPLVAYSTVEVSEIASMEGFGFKVYGNETYDYLGFKSLAGGDINNDGYSDLVAGASYANPLGRSNGGIVYVIFGLDTASVLAEFDLANWSPEWGFRIFGADEYNYFGGMLAVGDFNGDSYRDILISNIDYSNFNQSYFPTTMIYGSETPADVDMFDFSSEQGFSIEDSNGESFGWALAFCDFNNDGFDDMIISDYDATPLGRENAGILYFLYGNADGLPNEIESSDDIASPYGFKILGAVEGDNTGRSLTSVKDVNNDDFEDFAFSAPYAAPLDRQNAGIIYVILGRASLLSDIDLNSFSPAYGFKILGAAFSYIGHEVLSLSSAGDHDGDGFSDILFSTYQSEQIYFIRGRQSWSSQVDLASISGTDGYVIYGYTSDEEYFGEYVSSLGNFTGDQYDDVAVGAKYNKYHKSYLFFGHSSQSSHAKSSLNIDVYLPDIHGFQFYNPDGSYGTCKITGIGNYNGDGFDDIAFSGCKESPSDEQVEAGMVYVIFGGKHFPSFSVQNIKQELSGYNRGFKVYGENSYDHLGYSVAAGGDINDDSYDDFIISAPQADPESRLDAGIVYAVWGKQYASDIYLDNWLNVNGFRIIGAVEEQFLGKSLGSGTINGDDYADLLISRCEYDPDADVEWMNLVVFFGYDEIDGDIDLADVESDDERFQHVRILGCGYDDYLIQTCDFNNDGYQDVVLDDKSQFIYVIFGNSSGLNPVDSRYIYTSNITYPYGFQITRPQSYGMGESLATIGDINQDGYDDFMFSASYAGPLKRYNAGIIYVVTGRDDMHDFEVVNFSPTHGFRIFGALAGGYLGESEMSIAGAGDFNGDGYRDLIVSSQSNPSEGTAFVIFGQSWWAQANTDIDLADGLASNEGFVIHGAFFDAKLGYFVTPIGNFNGDHYDDVCIGNKVQEAYLFEGFSFSNITLTKKMLAFSVSSEIAIKVAEYHESGDNQFKLTLTESINWKYGINSGSNEGSGLNLWTTRNVFAEAQDSLPMVRLGPLSATISTPSIYSLQSVVVDKITTETLGFIATDDTSGSDYYFTLSSNGLQWTQAAQLVSTEIYDDVSMQTTVENFNDMLA